MDLEQYIASGVLELYVAGLLSEEKNIEVYQNAKAHPEIAIEIEAIEAAILALSKTAAPRIRNKGFEDVRRRTVQKRSTSKRRIQRTAAWPAQIGWAMAITMAVGLFWFYRQSEQLRADVWASHATNEMLQDEILAAHDSHESTQKLLQTIRDKNTNVVGLKGQAAAPDAFAKVYWNIVKQQILIDAMGLPEPPAGKVYQVWSLQRYLLGPTSLGTLDDFTTAETKIFILDHPNSAYAFGITLEPEGGSETPTMKQLCTLGNVTP